MMNYVENTMPRQLACPDGLADFYENLHHADDDRLHAVGVSTMCTRPNCNRNACPFRATPNRDRASRAGVSVESATASVRSNRLF